MRVGEQDGGPLARVVDDDIVVAMRDADSDDEIPETIHEQEELLKAVDVSDDEESDIDVDEGFDWIEFDDDQKEPDFKVNPNHVGI